MQRFFDLEGPAEFLDTFAMTVNEADNAFEGVIFSAGKQSGGAGPGPHETDRVMLNFLDHVSQTDAKNALERALDKVARTNDMENKRENIVIIKGPDAE